MVGTGYRPEVILDDRSATELEAIESMVGGYSQAVQSNHDSFFRVKMLLHIALLCVLAAPITGAAALAVGWYRSLPLSI